jgi:biopolymer transport protein ExbD
VTLAAAVGAVLVAVLVWGVQPGGAVGRGSRDGQDAALVGATRVSDEDYLQLALDQRLDLSLVTVILRQDSTWTVYARTGEPAATNLVWQGRSLEQLGKNLQELHHRCTAGQAICIRADSAATHHRVAQVMDLARRAGFVNQVMADGRSSTEPGEVSMAEDLSATPGDRSGSGRFRDYQLGARTLSVPASLLEALPESARGRVVARILDGADRMAMSMLRAREAEHGRTVTLPGFGENRIQGPPYVLEYTLQNSAQVVVRVYAVNGSPVSRLTDELQAAGAYRVAWDGKTAAAAEAPPGIYFLQLSVGSWNSATYKMVKR